MNGTHIQLIDMNSKLLAENLVPTYGDKMKMFFSGRFVPDRCGADLMFNIGPMLQKDGKPVANVYFRSLGSAFHGWIEYVPELQLLISDANEYIKSLILPFVRINGLFAVANFDLDIVEAFTEDGQQVAIFGAEGAGYGPIRLLAGPGLWDMIFKALNTSHGPFFRLALNDFSLATTDKELCPFHCYRAIESMRRVVQNKYQIDNRTAGWIKLREVVAIDEASLREIEEHATEIRHGKYNDADFEKRSRFIVLARQIIMVIAKLIADEAQVRIPPPLPT